MRKLVLFMHLSLDGFATDKTGGMDWITVDEQIFDFAGNRTNESDAALYGRKTFEMMDSYWPTAGDASDASKHDREHSAWYNQVPKYVASKTLKPPVNGTIFPDAAKGVDELKKQPGKEIIMFGSPSLAKSLMSANLIDEYWLFVNPVILGGGMSLFSSGTRINLKIRDTTSFSNGVVCLNYEKA